MLKSSNDIKGTLERHGTKVINALGVMVTALKTEDDAKLLAKISEVIMFKLRSYTSYLPYYMMKISFSISYNVNLNLCFNNT